MSFHLPILIELADYLTAHPEQTATAVLAIVGSLAHYRRTGNVPVGRLPWRQVRQLFREAGNQYFGVSRPRGVPGLVVDATPERVERALRDRHYESVDLYSYEYGGEIGNFRRPSGERPDPTTGEPTPMETHPRTFATADDRTLVLCHDEANRFEATGDHLDESMMSWDRGREIVAEDLEAAGINHRSIESERAAGIDVV